MGSTARKAVLFALAATLTGCLKEPREKHEALRTAEAQYHAVRQLAAEKEAQRPPLSDVVTGNLYEYGLVVPASHGLALGFSAPLFGVNEGLQLLILPAMWLGWQDSANDWTLDLYSRGASFQRVHGVFPRAWGGADIASWPEPPVPSPVRGDRPR